MKHKLRCKKCKRFTSKETNFTNNGMCYDCNTLKLYKKHPHNPFYQSMVMIITNNRKRKQ